MERQGTTRQRTPLTPPQKVARKQPVIVARKQPVITEDDLRRRAYEIYLNRGLNPGNEIEDWLQAERELKAN